MPSFPLTGMNLVTDRMSTLLRSQYHTKSDSTHPLGFRQTLGYWGQFELDARRYFLSIQWNTIVLDYAPDQIDYTKYHVKNEQLVCGDEHSVAARFNNNAGHVLTSVIRSCLQLDVKFSDYKAAKPTAKFKKVPDIVVIDSEGTIKMVGEVKTPWKHHIQTQMQTSPQNFRRYLGKIYSIPVPICQCANISSP